MDGLLNREFLSSIGVSLDNQTYNSLAEHYEQTLQDRVVTEIIEELNESQLQELHKFQESRDSAALREWLVANIPQLNEIVEDEVVILLGEIAENKDSLAWA